MSTWIKRITLKTKARFQENTLDSVLWLLDVVSSRTGYSILTEKFYVPFWVIHLILLMYVYLLGSVVFQIKYGQGTGDLIKGYVNISLLILTFNNSYWFITKRPLLKIVLSLMKQNDKFSRETASLKEKHEKCMAFLKRMVLVFYTLNVLDAFCIYLPNQIDPTNNRYSMTPCVGLEPLTTFPKRQICIVILLIQHVTLVLVVLSYQALLLLLIAHTAAMYHLLSEDIMMFQDIDNFPTTDIVKEKLFTLIRRHASILETIKIIKALYSMPIGVNFGTNAVCILFFFYIPLQEWVTYSPVLIYCFIVFFMYCFLCQKLINAAEVFERAVYSCGWERFKVTEQKLVYVMLMQAQKPILLLAAHIIPVNIYTFANTLQSLYKFITVVKL